MRKASVSDSVEEIPSSGRVANAYVAVQVLYLGGLRLCFAGRFTMEAILAGV
jgi:hypothetical protein